MTPKRSQFEIKTLFSVPPFTHLTLSVSFFFSPPSLSLILSATAMKMNY